jgi:hypothetical protein
MARAAAARIGLALIAAGTLAAPFVIFFSLPPFHTGIWYKSEPVIAALHALSALVSSGLALALLGGVGAAYRSLWHPFVLLPAALAGWSLLLLPFVPIPGLSWYGTPEFGQGIAWHLDYAVLVAGAMVALRLRRLRRSLAWATLAALALLTGSMIHTESGWYLAPFMFYDPLAFYALFGIPLLIVLFRPTRAAWRVALAGFGVAVVAVSRNRTAMLLALAAPVLVAGGLWLRRRDPRLLARLAAIAVLAAALVTTAAVWQVGERLPESSLWSRMLHLEVTRRSLVDRPVAVLTGRGWGSYGEWQLSHLPLGSFDLVGDEQTGADWDAVHGQIHFQSHNYLAEALLSAGLVALLLTWAIPAALPLFARRRYAVEAGVLAVLASALLCVWAHDAGAVPYAALAFAALARPVRARPWRRGRGLVPAAVLLVIALAQALSAVVVALDGAEMQRAAFANRDTAGLASVPLDDCSGYLDDHGRGGVHLATLYRSFAVDLADKLAAGLPITEADTARMANYICAVQSRISDTQSLRLANADLLVTAELVIMLDHPRLAPLAAARAAGWRGRLEWYLDRAPVRSDMAAPFLGWAFVRGDERAVAAIAARLLAHDANEPVGLWYSGAVMMGDPASAATGLSRMRRALEGGLERIMPVDPAIAEQIRNAPAIE